MKCWVRGSLQCVSYFQFVPKASGFLKISLNKFSFPLFWRTFVEGGRHIGSAARRELDLVKLGLFPSRPPPPPPGIFFNPSSSPLKPYFCLPQHSLSLFVQDPNRPFPSSCLLPLQSESKCEVFVMVISSTLHMNEN